MLDPDHRVRRVNRNGAEFVARPYLEIVGQRIEELLPPPLMQAYASAVVVEGEHRVEREVWLPATRRWFRLTLDPIRRDEPGLDGAVLSFADVTARKLAERATARVLEQRQRFATHLVRAREEERAAIAREIHDELGHALTALKLDLAWMTKRLPANQPELAERMTALVGLTDHTIAAARRLTTELRPGILDDFGLPAAIEWLGEQFSRRCGIPVAFVHEADLPEAPAPIATAAFRIVQEALTNVARHADAKRVDVSLRLRLADLELAIHDDGQGFSPGARRRSGSFGLIGMNERAMAVGGSLTLRSHPGRGTTIRVRLPLLRRKR